MKHIPNEKQIEELLESFPPNLTYPLLPCKAVNDVQGLDFKGPLYLQDRSHKYYLMVLRDKVSKKLLCMLWQTRVWMRSWTFWWTPGREWAVRNA